MKKQINPTIKAHLIRGAFYLLLLLAVCAIPFALAQSRSRGTAKRSMATPNAPANKDLSRATGPVILPGPASGVVGHGNGPTLPRTSQIPLASSGTVGGHIIPVPPPPGVPQVVLYDQYNNASLAASLSSTFTDFPTFNADLADDFVVPGGETWNVQSIDADGLYFNGPGPAASFNVFFYADNGGLPGAQVFSATNQPFTQNSSTFTVNLASPAVLTAGTYWVEMQGNMTFNPNGEWGWTDRTVQSNNPAAWQNPGGGFGLCPTWTVKTVLHCRRRRTRPGVPAEWHDSKEELPRLRRREVRRQRQRPRRAVTITRRTGTGTITLATLTQATIAMIAPPAFRFHSRSAFTHRPLTVQTSPPTAL